MLVAVAGALGLAPMTASASPPVPIPSLAGRTTVLASSTSVTTVRLPREIEMPRPNMISFHGRGRVRGFVLTQRGESMMEAPTYFTVAPGYCGTPGCGRIEAPRGGWSFLTGTPTGKLPAGEYRLFVIADSADLRVELTIPELRGRTTISPSEPAAIDVDSFRTHPIATPDGTVYTGGGFSDMGGDTRGFALLQMWGHRDAPEPKAYAWGTCIYREREHPYRDHAFAPGCPGSKEPQVSYVGNDRGYSLVFTAFDTLPDGMGGHSVTPLNTLAGGVGVWMPLSEALP